MCDKMDKSWMTINNRLTSKEYQQGVKSFLDFATANLGVEDEIRCPCVDCINGTKYSRQVVWMHLIRRGMASSYLTWVHHGEHVPVSRPSVSNDQYGGSGECMTDIDDPPMDELPIMLEEIYVSGLMDDHTDEEPNGLEREDLHKFTRLFEDAQRKVHPNCEKFSVLSFVIKMLYVKVYNKWSNKSFDMVMQVFKDILSECDPTVPWTLYDAKKFLRDLGLGYETIHSCKNDCALFWKESANLEKCPTCDACRYKLNDDGGKKIPHKDDILFEVLLQLFLVSFGAKQQVCQDRCDDMLYNLHYDHQVLLDYLISKDTGAKAAEYLLRNWKMVPGLKTGRLRKKTLRQPETDSPAAIPLGSPVAPSPVLPVRSNVGPSHHVTSQPMVDSDETQAPSEWRTLKPLRVRGPTLGKGIQKIIIANKGEKCYVHIDRGLNAMTGKYATPATNELGIQIRTLCPLKDVKSWLDLDETTKAAVIQGVLDKFQIGDDFHNDLQAQEIVNKKAYGLYKDWRYTLKQEFELLEGLPRDEIYGHPLVGVSLDNWKHLIDVAWQDASHQKRSKAGKSNRSQLPYNHTNGSRSFPIAMAAMAKDGELDFPKFYEDNHTSKKTNDWIHPKCHELHQEMVNVQAAAIESGTPLTQEEISRQALGQKKRYLLGFGSGPQPSTIFATRAHDKDMEAMRAEVEALREERQKDHDELMKEREERERCYNELLKEREERIQLSNEVLKEREEGQKARDETNTKVEHLNNVVAKLSQLLGV
ncbi:unnamed protein product [Camellia sinensis]